MRSSQSRGEMLKKKGGGLSYTWFHFILAPVMVFVAILQVTKYSEGKRILQGHTTCMQWTRSASFILFQKQLNKLFLNLKFWSPSLCITLLHFTYSWGKARPIKYIYIYICFSKFYSIIPEWDNLDLRTLSIMNSKGLGINFLFWDFAYHKVWGLDEITLGASIKVKVMLERSVISIRLKK